MKMTASNYSISSGEIRYASRSMREEVSWDEEREARASHIRSSKYSAESSSYSSLDRTVARPDDYIIMNRR